MEYVGIIVAAAVAVAFYALSVRSSLKNALISGILGGTSYGFYLLLSNYINPITSVFFATLTGCLSAELAARWAKTPATVFSIPVIIPLVPGLMLYNTMLKFGQGDTAGGGKGVVDTLILAGGMSLAVTLATLIAKLITAIGKRIEQKK